MLTDESASSFPSGPTSDPVEVSHASQATNCVQVLNLPDDATETWIQTLFSAIGRVVEVDFKGERGAISALVTFATVEQAEAAFRMNGYVVSGKCLHIVPASSGPDVSAIPRSFNAGPGPQTSEPVPAPNVRSRPASANPRPRTAELSPTHKNLYILNLPLDVTTDQLAGLFGRYGTVIHCVILAMLDSQARRRGFIDMSAPTEAKSAIEGLNGFVWHGYPIEVSYAIVQRSGGPFDPAGAGRNVIKRNVPRNRFNTGPRRVPSDSSPPTTPGLTAGMDYVGANVRTAFAPSPSPSSPECSDGGAGGSEPPQADPRAVYISGLNPDFVSSNEGLRRAVEHFGNVVRAAISRDEFGIVGGSGTVIFATEAEANQVVTSLHGKVVDGRRISAHLLRPYAVSLQAGAWCGRGWDTAAGQDPANNVELPRSGLADLALQDRPADRFTGVLDRFTAWQQQSAGLANLSSTTDLQQNLGTWPYRSSTFSRDAVPGLQAELERKRVVPGEYRQFGSHPFTFPRLGARGRDPFPSFGSTGETASSAQAPANSALDTSDARATAPRDDFILPLPLGSNSLGFPWSQGTRDMPQDNAASGWPADTANFWGPLSGSGQTCAGIWGPAWRPDRQADDGFESGRSVSSVDSAASVVRTPEPFERISGFAPPNNLWCMDPATPSTLQERSAAGCPSLLDQLREGSLAVLSDSASDPVVDPSEQKARRLSLLPVGYEKGSSPPKSQEPGPDDQDI